MFDSLAIAALADEARDLIGGRVQRVVQTDALSLGLELYAAGQRRWLLCTADPRRAGVWFVREKLGQSPAPPSPILLLCRKYLRAAILDRVDQPPFERILRLRFQADDDSVTRSLVLIVEATGRLGNVILVDERETVLEAIKRVPSSINRHRTILPRRPYTGPPAQDKATPVEADAAFWRPRLAGGVMVGAQAVTGALRGLSPQSAREAVYRASGAVDTPAGALDPERLAAAVAELTAPMAAGGRATWQPSVGLDEAGRATAFAPYELRHLGRWERTASLSAAAERFFGQESGPTAAVQRRHPLQREIEAARTSERRKLEALERQLAGAAEADALRTAGELLLAYATQVPQGAASVELADQTIALDPDRTAVENAQRYFERYTRLRDARRQLPELIAGSRAAITYLDEALMHLELATTPEDVAALRSEVQEELGRSRAREQPSRRGIPRSGRPGPPARGKGGGPPAKTGAAKARPASPLRLRLGDHTLYVGRTARQNDEATFDLGRPQDLWLHARGVAGAHVLLRVDAGTPNEATIRQAAQIAAYHSEARTAASVPVDVTERRHVRKLKGGPPGAVTYSGERTISVAPAAHDGGRHVSPAVGGSRGAVGPTGRSRQGRVAP